MDAREARLKRAAMKKRIEDMVVESEGDEREMREDGGAGAGAGEVVDVLTVDGMRGSVQTPKVKLKKANKAKEEADEGDENPPKKRRKAGVTKAVASNPTTYTLDPRCVRCAKATTECVFYLSPTKSGKSNIRCVRCKDMHRGCKFDSHPPAKVPKTDGPIPVPQTPSAFVVDYPDMRYTPIMPHSNAGSSTSAAPGAFVSMSAVPGVLSSAQADEALRSDEALRLRKDIVRLERTMVDGLQTLTNLFLENMGRKAGDEQGGKDSQN